jgi:hypothetical protein
MSKHCDKVAKYNWAGKPSENAKLQWLKVGLLEVDHSYQRERLYEPQVLSIARAFNWAFFGALTVKKRDGKYFVIDGQHRLAAAIRRGDIHSVPCSVTESCGVADEAVAFVNNNSNRKVVSSFDKYRAMVVACDPTHLGVKEMLEARGLTVSESHSPWAVTFPNCVVSLYKISPIDIAAVLDIQREMIGQKERMSNLVTKGLFLLVRRDPQNKQRLIAAADSVFRRGGKSILEQSIRRVCIEAGTSTSDRSCAAGVAAAVNVRRNSVNRVIL